MSPSHILAVMGLTGAGKSSFVKLVTGNANIIVGHSISSETKEIASYPVVIQGQNFVLVDTPGFEDTDMTDTEVLKMLVDWLASTYRAGKKLNGILYLYRIDETRMKGSSLRNLNMFKQLCGDDFYTNLTLGTTCWSIVPYNTAVLRETELKSNMSFWKTMISKGAGLERIPDDATEARNLVYRIATQGALPLQVQREVVDGKISFNNLQVTQVVKRELELEEVRKAQVIREAKLLKDQNKQRLEMEAEQAMQSFEQARQQRMQHYSDIRRYCSRKKPFGTCDRAGCNEKLKRWKTIYHCCSCNSAYDNYWQCPLCGNDCGNSEHPYMSRIDNSDEDCVIL